MCCSSKRIMYLFKICLLSLVVIFVASKTLSGGVKPFPPAGGIPFPPAGGEDDKDIAIPLTGGDWGGSDGGKDKGKVDPKEQKRLALIKAFDARVNSVKFQPTTCKNQKYGAIEDNGMETMKLNCDRAAPGSCGLVSYKTYNMAFKFTATKDLVQQKSLKYHFCARMWGACLSDMKPVPDLCPILGCPLQEGKQYIVNIPKTIPYLFMSMQSAAEISLLDEKSKAVGCVSFHITLKTRA